MPHRAEPHPAKKHPVYIFASRTPGDAPEGRRKFHKMAKPGSQRGHSSKRVLYVAVVVCLLLFCVWPFTFLLME